MSISTFDCALAIALSHPTNDALATRKFEQLQSDFLDSNGMDHLGNLFDAIERGSVTAKVEAVDAFAKQWQAWVEERAGR